MLHENIYKAFPTYEIVSLSVFQLQWGKSLWIKAHWPKQYSEIRIGCITSGRQRFESGRGHRSKCSNFSFFAWLVEHSARHWICKLNFAWGRAWPRTEMEAGSSKCMFLNLGLALSFSAFYLQHWCSACESRGYTPPYTLSRSSYTKFHNFELLLKIPFGWLKNNRLALLGFMLGTEILYGPAVGICMKLLLMI